VVGICVRGTCGVFFFGNVGWGAALVCVRDGIQDGRLQ